MKLLRILWMGLLLGLLLPGVVMAEDGAAQVDCRDELALTENGRPDTVALVLDTGALMAGSGTPYRTRQRDATLLIDTLLERLTPGTVVSLIGYDSTTRQYGIGAAGEVRAALERLQPGGPQPADPAALTAALEQAQTYLAPTPNARHTLVLFAAGLPEGAWPESLPADAGLIVVDLGGGAPMAAWAAAQRAVYIPFQAEQARELPARFAALDAGLRPFTAGITNQRSVTPFAPSNCGPDLNVALDHSLTDDNHSWTFGLGGGALMVLGLGGAALVRQRWMKTQPQRHGQSSFDEGEPITNGRLRTPSKGSTNRRTRARQNYGDRIITARQSSTVQAERRSLGSFDGTELRRGTRCGEFGLKRTLGVGGQARCYLALGPGARRVVVKIAHPEGEAALHDEHAWLSRPTARHPHLVRLASYAAQRTLGIAAGPSGQRCTWIALEYVRGRPLVDLLRHRKLRSDQALAVALQTAQALDHLHRIVGIVHQDVTPANLIVRRHWNGTLHTTLIDLGVADAPAQPRRRACYGTGPYIAPERRREPPPPPDPQSDIFALGVLLDTLTTDNQSIAGLNELITAMTQPEVAARRAAIPTMAAVVVRLEGMQRRIAAKHSVTDGTTHAQ